MMKASRLRMGLRVCVLALCLCMMPAAMQAQNNSNSGGASQSSSQTTTTTQTTQAAPPAQSTRVVTRDSTANNQTLYWILGIGVLALLVIVAIVALSKRSRNEA